MSTKHILFVLMFLGLAMPMSQVKASWELADPLAADAAPGGYNRVSMDTPQVLTGDEVIQMRERTVEEIASGMVNAVGEDDDRTQPCCSRRCKEVTLVIGGVTVGFGAFWAVVLGLTKLTCDTIMYYNGTAYHPYPC
jgi:hypothetical protein